MTANTEDTWSLNTRNHKEKAGIVYRLKDHKLYREVYP